MDAVLKALAVTHVGKSFIDFDLRCSSSDHASSTSVLHSPVNLLPLEVGE